MGSEKLIERGDSVTNQARALSRAGRPGGGGRQGAQREPDPSKCAGKARDRPDAELLAIGGITFDDLHAEVAQVLRGGHQPRARPGRLVALWTPVAARDYWSSGGSCRISRHHRSSARTA
jgi:hypothetical protein